MGRVIGVGQPVLVMLAAGMAKRYGGGCKPLAPVGPHGEAVIDLNASDAMAAGFGEVVMILGPETGPAIAYHIEHTWPATVPVTLTEQLVPLGTAHAALCAHSAVGDRPFALVNGDDVYGADALHLLCHHLEQPGGHVNVAFRLADTVVSDEPVTRGTCTVGPDGLLAGMEERKLVTRQPDGSFRAGDGKQPETLAPDTLVSVNLWGLRPSIWPVLEAAVRSVHPAVGDDGIVEGELANEEEVLLPEVVGTLVNAGVAEGPTSQPVKVLEGPGRCIGVTHLDDLPVVRTEIAVMIGQGLRPERLWSVESSPPPLEGRH